MPIHWRSQTEIAEDNRYGRHDDRPVCKTCGRLIRDDNWRGGPMRGYVCSGCDGKERLAAAITQEILELQREAHDES